MNSPAPMPSSLPAPTPSSVLTGAASPHRPPAAGARRWRVAAAAIGAVFALPVAAGIAGVALPAIGYLPALGHRDLGLQAFAELAAQPGLLRSALLSAGTGLAATALSLALTLAVLAAAFETRALALVERCLAPLLSVPHAAAAIAFVFVLAPSGLLLRLASPWATGLEIPPDIAIVHDRLGLSLVAALTVKEVPFLFLMALAALGQLRARERVAVARALGYGRIAAFVHCVWPHVYRQIRLPVLAVLAFCASAVDVAMIVGPTRPPPLAVRVVDWLHGAALDGWLVGSAGAVAMLGLVVAAMALWLLGERLVAGVHRALATSGRRFAADWPVRLAVLAGAAAAAALTVLGLVGLVALSVAGYWPFPDALPAHVSFAVWRERLPHAAVLLRETLAIAVGATALSLPVAVIFAEAARRGAGALGLIYLPLLVPQVAFLFGLGVLSVAAGMAPGRGAVMLCHALFTLPYGVIALSGPWRALDPRYEKIAASLGAGPWRRFVAVRLAMMTGPLCVAAALSVAVSVGLYLPTRMIGAGRVETVTTAAVAAASGGDRRLAAMLACLQLVVPFLAFALAHGVPAAVFRHRRGLRQGRAAR